MPLDLGTILLTGTIFLFAAFFHGSIGFGFPMVATPLLALTTVVIALSLLRTVLAMRAHEICRPEE